MTHDEFWAKARAAGPWRFKRGMVRSSSGCPLRAVFGPWHVGAGSLPSGVAGRIAQAADYADDRFRPLLLRELGLA